MLVSLLLMLSVRISGGGLCYLATREVTPTAHSYRLQPKFRRFMLSVSADVALNRELSYVLVLLLLLGITLHLLRALALLLGWAKAC